MMLSGSKSDVMVRATSAVAITITLVCALTGCFLSATDEHRTAPASGQPASSQAQSALSTLVRQASDSTRLLNSVHLLLSTTGKIDGLGRISAANLDVEIKPLRAVGTVTYDGQLDVPFRLADDSVSVHLFDEWTMIGSVSDLFPPGLIDPTTGVGKILDSVTDLQSQGTETINGIPTAKITGKISAQTATIMLPQADGTKDITVWIRADGNHELVRSLVEVSPGNTVQNTLSNWNAPAAPRSTNGTT